jgi:hypothetical protein
MPSSLDPQVLAVPALDVEMGVGLSELSSRVEWAISPMTHLSHAAPGGAAPRSAASEAAVPCVGVDIALVLGDVGAGLDLR